MCLYNPITLSMPPHVSALQANRRKLEEDKRKRMKTRRGILIRGGGGGRVRREMGIRGRKREEEITRVEEDN